ncbi:transcriptional regulator FtrA [Trinickia mobilis]|uniref:transcriptional regulator FtrA n=1 Tax=Trinickia mobilis TaxID=2816356 RepID=UPI001A8E2373|nr:transcriptional regulator FtrA [Trinickia mobilis]
MAHGSHVTAVTYEGLCTFEFGIAVEVFGLARPEFDFPWYKFTVCAAERRPIAAVGGIMFSAPHGLEELSVADTIVVPGWRDIFEEPPAELCDALVSAQTRGARLVSICGGAFVLAAAGLLDGKSATTHWRFADELARRYPRISVRADKLYTDDGQILTAAGSAAGIDLCLHLVRKDYGVDVAYIVSQRLIAQPTREGGQSQFIPTPSKSVADPQLTKVMAWLASDLRKRVSISELAARVHLSERTLHRRFVDYTGKSPLEWLTVERLRRARLLLEHSDMSIEEIGCEAGYGNVEAFRRQFKARVGLAPSSYRTAFRFAET